MGMLLSEPSAVKLQEKFNKHAFRRKKVKIALSDLLKLYSNPDMSFKKIGQILGITAEPARGYYRDYCEPLIGMTGWDRRRLRFQKRREQALRESLDISEQPSALQLIADQAQKAGLPVQRVPKKGREFSHSNGLCNSSLEIQGLVCAVHVLTSARKHAKHGSSQRYIGFSISRSHAAKYAAHILVLQIPRRRTRFLVVPSYVIAKINGRSNQARACIVLGKHSEPVLIDWWKYENAWHLLA